MPNAAPQSDHGLVARWDGSGWRTVHEPGTEGGFTDVSVVSAADVWISGERQPIGVLFERWDDRRWKLVQSPATDPRRAEIPASVSGSDSADVWAVGSGAWGSDTFSAHWDGRRWSPVSLPLSQTGAQPWDVVALTRSNAWLVGQLRIVTVERIGQSQRRESDRLSPLIEHWNGRTWAVVPPPNGP